MLLLLIEPPNIFHKKLPKNQSGCGIRDKIWGRLGSNILKKLKKLALSIDFFIFCMGNTFKSKKWWLIKLE